MRRILCVLFGHRRDSRRAHPSSIGWRAPCLLCGERMVRTSSGQWRIALNEESCLCFTPYASVPRQPFCTGGDADAAGSGSTQEEGERDGEGQGQSAAYYAKDKICAADDRSGGNHAQPLQSDQADRTQRLLRDLFEQTPLAEQILALSDDFRTGARAQRGDQRGDQVRQTGGDHERTDGRSEAEMFAIAFTCCRELLFRLSDQFSRQISGPKQSDDAPTVNR